MTTTIIQAIADLESVSTIAASHNPIINELINALLSLRMLLIHEILVLKNMMSNGKNATKKYP